MQSKLYNSYRITHKSGAVEEINAVNLVEALSSMSIKEEFDPVLQTYMQAQGIRTLVNDLPEEVPFTAVVNEEAGGSIATPVSGTVHAGDQLAFKAIPARNYIFVEWRMNGKAISTEAEFVYTFPSLEGEASAVFTAVFAPSPLAWATEVEPSSATSAGVMTFPSSGVSPASGKVSAVAIEAEGFTFDHWERNGESVSTNKVLDVDVVPLAKGEASAVYKAVFTEV